MTNLPILHQWVDALTYARRFVNVRQLLDNVRFESSSKTHFAYSAVRVNRDVVLWLRPGLLDLPAIESQEILTSAVVRCHSILNNVYEPSEQSICRTLGVCRGSLGNIADRWRIIYTQAIPFSAAPDARQVCGLCLRPIASDARITSGVHTQCLDFARARLIGRFRAVEPTAAPSQAGLTDAD
jgi:hypothetical protein